MHVLERGRETRPTAPVLCDHAEENRKREEIHIAITKGEDDRRRETRPSAPVENHHAHRGLKERRRTQKRRESGPPWKGPTGGEPRNEETPRKERGPKDYTRTKGRPEMGSEEVTLAAAEHA